MSKADETIKQAVKDSIGVLTEHFQPGDPDARGKPKPQDSDATVAAIGDILDNDEVREAIEESDSAKEDAREAGLSQKPADQKREIKQALRSGE